MERAVIQGYYRRGLLRVKTWDSRKAQARITMEESPHCTIFLPSEPLPAASIVKAIEKGAEHLRRARRDRADIVRRERRAATK